MRKAWSFVWRWIGNLLRVKALWDLVPPGVAATLSGYFAWIKDLPLGATTVISVGMGLFVLILVNLARAASVTESPIPSGSSNTTSGARSPIAGRDIIQAGRDVIQGYPALPRP